MCTMNVITSGLFLISSVISALAYTPALKLTPYIKSNRTEEARNLSYVDPRYFLNVSSYSGFFTVNEAYDSNIFFWYFPIDKPVKNTPWIVWLQGGPGATSMAGLFDEVGPFKFEKQLNLREWSWTKNYPMLFIDNPVGAGYSFTNHDNGFITDMKTCSDHLYSVLKQFLKIFPELSKSPLYIAGESYAGKYLPALGMKILKESKHTGNEDINLKGIIMGNPVLNRENIKDYSKIFYQWGLIDTQGLLAAKPLQDEYNQAIENNDNKNAFQLRDKLLDKLQDIAMQSQIYNALKGEKYNMEKLIAFGSFVEKPEIREALHVSNLNFTFSNYTVHKKLTNDFLSDVDTKLGILLDHYKILIYCGQLDLTTPCVPNAEYRRKNWRWSHRDSFLKASRTPWWYNETVAGYVKSGGGFTEVLVNNAGHMVPLEKPAATQLLISYFIRGLDMPLPPDYYVSSPALYKDETDPKNTITAPSNNSSLIASVAINIILGLTIVTGIIYFISWKRKATAMFYNSVDDNSITDGILTMS